MGAAKTKAELLKHECRIRDFYAQQIASQRPRERVIAREYHYRGARARADLRTVDEAQVLREWEFKIRADYRALGQVLVYIAMARHEVGFNRQVRGVIAAFEVPSDLRLAIETLNLNIEFVTLPSWMAGAGEVPVTAANPIPIPVIPIISPSGNDQR
jgi:hypothetical protein